MEIRCSGSNYASFGNLLPRAARYVEMRYGLSAEPLLPEEVGELGVVGPERLREFTAGRACARQALRDLGRRGEPILRGKCREPLWPHGVVGCITHSDGYAAACAASSDFFAGIGIDLEPDAPLLVSLRRRITCQAEHDWICSRQGDANWDRLLFGVKECVYKIWQPLMRTHLGFRDVVVEFDPSTSSFEAGLQRKALAVGARAIKVFSGRYCVGNGFLFTAIVVQRDVDA